MSQLWDQLHAGPCEDSDSQVFKNLRSWARHQLKVSNLVGLVEQGVLPQELVSRDISHDESYQVFEQELYEAQEIHKEQLRREGVQIGDHTNFTHESMEELFKQLITFDGHSQGDDDAKSIREIWSYINLVLCQQFQWIYIPDHCHVSLPLTLLNLGQGTFFRNLIIAGKFSHFELVTGCTNLKNNSNFMKRRFYNAITDVYLKEFSQVKISLMQVRDDEHDFFNLVLSDGACAHFYRAALSQNLSFGAPFIKLASKQALLKGFELLLHKQAVPTFVLNHDDSIEDRKNSHFKKLTWDSLKKLTSLRELDLLLSPFPFEYAIDLRDIVASRLHLNS